MRVLSRLNGWPMRMAASVILARQSGWESRDNQDENAPLPG
jgi:hypothetical protein